MVNIACLNGVLTEAICGFTFSIFQSKDEFLLDMRAAIFAYRVNDLVSLALKTCRLKFGR
jgi:hypothetical protein